jgi:hypothetical protein
MVAAKPIEMQTGRKDTITNPRATAHVS